MKYVLFCISKVLPLFKKKCIKVEEFEVINSPTKAPKAKTEVHSPETNP